MFFGCPGLTSLDVSGFNTANVTDMSNMFDGCSELTTIYAGDDWSTEKVRNSEYMFAGCTKLVGGMGTTFDPNFTNAEYARIDGGLENPGYFTAKVDFIRGDVNGDNTVGMDDLTALINYLVYGTPVNVANSAACSSVNDTTVVNMDDLTALINYLVYNHW